MEALFIIINHEKHFDQLLAAFQAAHIRGGTILESQGLAASMAEHSQDLGYQYFRMILNEGRPYNKTVFLVGSHDHIEAAKACVREAVGSLDRENIGIMFTVPVSSMEGLTK